MCRKLDAEMNKLLDTTDQSFRRGRAGASRHLSHSVVDMLVASAARGGGNEMRRRADAGGGADQNFFFFSIAGSKLLEHRAVNDMPDGKPFKRT